MVRSDKACSGVMFSVDTESGFPNIVIINGSWGLGEMIVKGEVTPDEFIVWKEGLKTETKRPIIEKKLGVKLRKMIYHPHAGSAVSNIQQTKIVNTSAEERETFVLSDKEVAQLATWGTLIEKHYTDHYKKWTPMDMEWAKDGVTGRTVHRAGAPGDDPGRPRLFEVEGIYPAGNKARDFDRRVGGFQDRNGKGAHYSWRQSTSVTLRRARCSLRR